MKIKVNDSHEFEFKNSDIEKIDLLKRSAVLFHIIEKNKSFAVKLEKSDFNNREYMINVNANNYTVKISNEIDQLIKEMGFTIGSSIKANSIKAPMPGIILSVNVEENQEVKEGDTLLILEAMKMENAISAPKTGVIKSIYAKSGETVDKGALLIEMA
ncbi:MAG: acyl-CoA carboxylase biotin carboxyl carrier protein subunit [Lutibacter sp.]|nr:MAG: acetyl-CoA carboxylase biotin carboxyl carrier protein subunit [Lutibacter sp. BRH_c52]HCE54887.1 acetyl-CoA carboxylase biotin carboxyl carrier protein subunit [Lutibacter sp.]